MVPHCFSTFSLLFFCFVTVQSEVFKLNGQQIQLDPGVTEPPDKILWTHNGNKLMEFNGTVEKVFGPYVGRVTLNRLTAQLQISDLRFEDSGKYECEIQGKTPLSSHKLVVIEKIAKPTITCEISPDSSLSAVLHCNEDLNQPPAPLEFMWFSKGELHPGTRLTISLGGELEEQQYTCQLSNPLSQENATFIAKDCNTVPDAGLSGGPIAAIVTFTVMTVCVVILLLALKHRRSKKKKEKKARELELESRRADPNETDALIESGIDLDHKEKYKMDYERRGLALIFNHERFNWQSFMRERHGSSVDCGNLKRSLQELNFEVRIYTDSTRKDVLRQVKEAAKEDHSDVDCFLLIFLSHGDDDKVYAYDGTIHTEEIVEQFKGDKCMSLVGKPKIFIFQADRGNRFDVPVMAGGAVGSEQTTNEDSSIVQTLPASADIIKCYASPEGYYAFRNTATGTWYIQSLCELLNKYGNTVEFTDLLTLVNRKVSMMNASNVRVLELSGKKQIPCFTSMLTKELYFHPKTLQNPQKSVLDLSD